MATPNLGAKAAWGSLSCAAAAHSDRAGDLCMTSKFRATAAVAVSFAAAALFACGPAWSQERVNGAIQGRNFLGQSVSPDEIKVFHGSEFKGAHKVAISVFDVAFPDQNHFTANTRGNMF